MIANTLLWLYTHALRLLPTGFRAEFGEEMAAVFQDLLAEGGRHGAPALLRAGWREFRSLPRLIWRAHRRAGGKGGAPALWGASRSPFHPVPCAGDGRDSWLQTVLEMAPLLLAGGVLLIDACAPAGIAAQWRQLWKNDVGGWLLPAALPFLLSALYCGLPRWSYAPAGLLAGWVLATAPSTEMFGFWIGALLAAYALLLLAVYVHAHSEPLAPWLQRSGHSLALDWTRASFAAYAMLPYVVAAAFDNTLRNDRTPYFALAILAMNLGSLLYCRSQSQQRALGALVGGATAVILAAMLEQTALLRSHWPAEIAWLGALWLGMILLLLLPIPASMLHRLWRTERSLRAERE